MPRGWGHAAPKERGEAGVSAQRTGKVYAMCEFVFNICCNHQLMVNNCCNQQRFLIKCLQQIKFLLIFAL